MSGETSITRLCAAAGTLAVPILLATVTPAYAQRYQNIGPRKCLDCHDHEKEKLWSEKQDGPPPNNHLNALKQMESDKTPKFIKAIGLADPYDPKGACAGCHATIVRNNVDYGVTCESCHGPASAYNDVHQEKGAYRKAVAVGLNDTIKNPDRWVPICMKCHVMDDHRLIAAGHPSGDDFNLGVKFGTVALHWKSSYPNKADITARGRAAFTPLAAARKGEAPASATAAASETNRAPAPTAAAPPPLPSEAPRAAAPAEASTARPRAAEPRAAGLPPPPPPPLPPIADNSGAALNASLPPAAGLPPSPAAAVAAVQGRLIVLMDSLLRRGARSPVRVIPPETKTPYRGPDATLLNLQQEVLALALEALGTAPKTEAAPAAK